MRILVLVAAALSVALVVVALLWPLFVLVLGGGGYAALMGLTAAMFGVVLMLPVIWLFVFVVYVLRKAARTLGEL